MDDIDKILLFLQEAEKLNQVERGNYRTDGKNENVSEHSWHLSLFLMLFEDSIPKDLDFKKMLKMAIIHDLVEIYADDTFLYDEKHNEDKKEREDASMKKIMSQLPGSIGSKIKDLFYEFEDATTRESKFVNSFDKLQPIVQNLNSKGRGWKEHNITYDQVDSYKRKHMLHDKFVLELYEKIMKTAKEDYFNKGD